MKQTTNYQLSQWEAEDKVLRTDFNADNAKIDAALAGLQTIVDGKGNCRVKIGFYTGNGDIKRVMSIETDFTPQALLVVGTLTVAFIVRGVENPNIIRNNYPYQIYPTWSDTSVSWRGSGSSSSDSSHFMNSGSTTYCYAVFG